jgi:predicted alpha/beta hydrolase family esterase
MSTGTKRSDAEPGGPRTLTTVLILPGWQGSGPRHWQSLWEQAWGDVRVQQHDWDAPLRGDWICQLEQAVLAQPGPLLLAAHSLGCHLAAGWAASSRHAQRVRGALLVAPPDLQRDDLPPALYSWRGHARAALPFAAHLISSDDDPFCAPAPAAALAADWGARHATIGACGHINADSGLADWPQGRAWLLELDSTTTR